MDFSIERTDFPSAIHRKIYCAARQLTPLSLSLEGIADPPLRDACAAFHAFMLDLFSDLYDHPEAYGLPVLELDTFLEGRTANAAKRKNPSKAKKLIAQVQNSVTGYQHLLCLLGKLGTLEEDRLIVADASLAILAKQTSTSVSPIPLETRLTGLARVGLEREGNAFAAPRHPDMLRGLQALALSFDKLNSFGFFAFQNLEFRNLSRPYKPTYEDYTRPLIASRRALADQVRQAAQDLGLSPQCNTFWKVDYKYKGMQALCLENHDGDLVLRVTETYGWDDPSLINGRLAEESPDFQRYILRHVWGCTGCSTDHLGRFTTILGKKRRVCMGGGIGFRWINPNARDLEAVVRCMRFRCAIVRDLKAAKA
ncbi:MAG TPA: hypothetical protein PKE04_12125 [Clostridia bacterium]|nr:hypothetical protein [Clostridia bacterium]